VFYRGGDDDDDGDVNSPDNEPAKDFFTGTK
jgi:hypothetical protein